MRVSITYILAGFLAILVFTSTLCEPGYALFKRHSWPSQPLTNPDPPPKMGHFKPKFNSNRRAQKELRKQMKAVVEERNKAVEGMEPSLPPKAPLWEEDPL